MKRAFVKIKNVREFVASQNRLRNAQSGIPRMCMVSGKFGVGRSETMLWWTAQNEDVRYIRLLSLMTGSWMLSTVIAELGQIPERKKEDRFKQAIEILLNRPTTLIFDEIDYIAGNKEAVETLRDIHDLTGTIIVFVGMEDVEKKIKRLPHLYDRMTERIKFDNLTLDDFRLIATEKCDVKLTDDAVSYLHGIPEGARFRPLIQNLYKAEAIARANSLKEVTAADFQKVKK